MQNKRNKIALLLNAFWNNGKGMSGGDWMLIQIFKRIQPDFQEVFCYTSSDGRTVIEKDVMNIKFKITSSKSRKIPLIIEYILRTLRALDILKTRDLDIMYGGSDFFPDVVPAFFYKISNPKVRWFNCVFHVYTDWRKRPGSKVRNLVAQYLQKISFIFLKKADVIITINTQTRNELEALGFDKERLVINTPGIDTNYFESLNTDEATKKYHGSFLARLHPTKGIFDLVEIWGDVVKHIPDAKLAVIGGGGEEILCQLKERVAEAGLGNNIDILGFLENDESFSIIKNSDVFLFPSHEEGFGIVIAEAMACGTPVVCWDLPVYEELFEKHPVKIIENEIEEFSKNILKIIEKKPLERIESAKTFTKKYSWDNIAKRHIEILTNL